MPTDVRSNSIVEPDARFVVVSLPAEILIQLIEAQPSLYDPALVERLKRLRVLMKQKGTIPQFDEIPHMDLPVPLPPEEFEAVSEDAKAAGRTLAEQIQYEIEVNHGWRFPDPGDTAREEQIREFHTLRECLNLYLRFHVRFFRAPRNPARLLLQYAGPLLSVPPSKLTRTSVMQWAQTIGRQHPAAAMNAIGWLRGLYAKANEWGLYDGDNPATHHRLFPKRSRSRFLQPEEIARLVQALTQLPIHKETYFLTLLLTGCRRSEAAKMQWTHLDLTRGLWHKPTTKTGEPHTIPLPQALLTRFLQLPRCSAWVFPGERPDGSLSSTAIQYHWHKTVVLADIPDVRIHDLRRTCASWMAINGENLAVIQKVLNHSSLAVTEVYARLNVAPVRAALEGNARRMLLPENGAPLPPRPDDESRNAIEWPG